MVLILSSSARAWPSVPMYLTSAISLLLLTVLLVLCQNAVVLKKLSGVVILWYYVLSVGGGRVCNDLIFGPRFWVVDGSTDAARQFSVVFRDVAVTFAIIMSLACLDAIPPRVTPGRARTAFTLFVSIFQSVTSFWLTLIAEERYCG